MSREVQYVRTLIFVIVHVKLDKRRLDNRESSQLRANVHGTHAWTRFCHTEVLYCYTYILYLIVSGEFDGMKLTPLHNSRISYIHVVASIWKPYRYTTYIIIV